MAGFCTEVDCYVVQGITPCTASACDASGDAVAGAVPVGIRPLLGLRGIGGDWAVPIFNGGGGCLCCLHGGRCGGGSGLLRC